jgi:hypothetical protein
VIIDERSIPKVPSSAAASAQQASPATSRQTSPAPPRGRTVRTGSAQLQPEFQSATQRAMAPRIDAPRARSGSASPARSAIAQLTATTAQRSTNGIASATLSSADIDFIVRELEQRVLAELDRRGGRYAGSF